MYVLLSRVGRRLFFGHPPLSPMHVRTEFSCASKTFTHHSKVRRYNLHTYVWLSSGSVCQASRGMSSTGGCVGASLAEAIATSLLICRSEKRRRAKHILESRFQGAEIAPEARHKSARKTFVLKRQSVKCQLVELVQIRQAN